MMPMPPSRAIAIAMRASVTVSMALETSGVATVMRRVTRDDVSASLGMTSVCPGRSRTSSYVSPTKPKGSLCSMGSPARAARCSSVDDDGRCARSAPYSILSVVGCEFIPRARRARADAATRRRRLRFDHGATRCCRRNRNDTLRSYRRSSRPMRPELRCLRRADWEVLWVLGLKPRSARSRWLVILAGALMAAALLLFASPVAPTPPGAAPDEPGGDQEATDYYFGGVIKFDDEPVPDVVVSVEGGGFEAETDHRRRRPLAAVRPREGRLHHHGRRVDASRRRDRRSRSAPRDIEPVQGTTASFEATFGLTNSAIINLFLGEGERRDAVLRRPVASSASSAA